MKRESGEHSGTIPVAVSSEFRFSSAVTVFQFGEWEDQKIKNKSEDLPDAIRVFLSGKKEKSSCHGHLKI